MEGKRIRGKGLEQEGSEKGQEGKREEKRKRGEGKGKVGTQTTKKKF